MIEQEGYNVLSYKFLIFGLQPNCICKVSVGKANISQKSGVEAIF